VSACVRALVDGRGRVGRVNMYELRLALAVVAASVAVTVGTVAYWVPLLPVGWQAGGASPAVHTASPINYSLPWVQELEAQARSVGAGRWSAAAAAWRGPDGDRRLPLSLSLSLSLSL
jgi:hypothetical protein